MHLFIIIGIVQVFFILPIDFAIGGTLYKCTDNNGNVTLTDTILIKGHKCEPLERFQPQTHEELLKEEKENQALREAEKSRTVSEDALISAERKRKSLLNQCFEDAQKRYNERWNADCKLHKRSDGCVLPIENTKQWDDIRSAERNQCLQEYPQLPPP